MYGEGAGAANPGTWTEEEYAALAMPTAEAVAAAERARPRWAPRSLNDHVLALSRSDVKAGFTGAHTLRMTAALNVAFRVCRGTVALA